LLDEAKAKPEPGAREVVNGFSGSSVMSESAMAFEKPGLGCTPDAWSSAQPCDKRRGFLCTGELGGVGSGTVSRQQFRETSMDTPYGRI